MKFQIISLLPEIVKVAFQHGVVGQAVEKKLIQISYCQPRDFTEDTHKTVDDRPYGGGDGMIMMASALEKAIQSIPTAERGRVIYLSPQGRKLNDQLVKELADQKNITLICGRYGGIDQRFIQKYVNEEISIGDYVLSGGELAAAVIIDAVSRMIPGVLGHGSSASDDSFSSGYLECPQFTRPGQWEGMEVPSVLLSGDHQKIQKWKAMVAVLVTYKKRPDLLVGKISVDQKKELVEFYQKLSSEDKKILGIEDLMMRDFKDS